MNEVKGYERKILVELHTNIVTGRVDEKIELEKDNKEVKVYTLVGKAGNDHFGIIAIERVIEAEITEEDIEVVTKKIKEYIEKLKGFGATKAKYIIEVTTISRDEKSSNFKKIRKLSETLGFSFQNFPQKMKQDIELLKKVQMVQKLF
jgi:ribosomal protein S13